MNKVIIGVLPLVDNEKESYWMLPGYMEGITEAGSIPVMLPLTEDKDTIQLLTKKFDGFLFTGGQDVSPELYREEKKSVCGECSPKRDNMEMMLLHSVLEADKPILGICRGIQFINAALGGTLYQDIPTMKPSGLEHHQNPPYDIPIHKVDILKNTPLFELLEISSLDVNSYHHQAVKTLSPKLKPMAYAPDGLVEAVYMQDKRFVWAVQWHPEFSHKTDSASKKIFEEFIIKANG